jgi:hypothetical protein
MFFPVGEILLSVAIDDHETGELSSYYTKATWLPYAVDKPTLDFKRRW